MKHTIVDMLIAALFRRKLPQPEARFARCAILVSQDGKAIVTDDEGIPYYFTAANGSLIDSITKGTIYSRMTMRTLVDADVHIVKDTAA